MSGPDNITEVFFPGAIQKLKERFCSDEMNFFDPDVDFTIDVSGIHLLDKLAKGSYGIVYKAAIDGKEYAVKVEDLRTGLEEQLNVLSELTILQSLPHPHLVKFYGTGYLSKSLAEAKVLIVMELCERGALRERICDGLPWPLIVRLGLDIAEGLGFLHLNHICHRDIKTTNILIDKEWRAKICDFSFSCQSTSRVKNEYIYGTDEFMAPEISMGEEFNESAGGLAACFDITQSSNLKADIFSFGIVLCEMITRREPSSTFLKRHAHPDCFALPELELRDACLCDCPESLEALTLQCCDIDPGSRPSAEDCAEWLQSLLEDMGGFDVDKEFERSSTPSAVVAASPVREGTVIYPKTRDGHRYSYMSRSSLESKQDHSAAPDIATRLSYLEIQIQELRAENKHLSREVMRLTAFNKDSSAPGPLSRPATGATAPHTPTLDRTPPPAQRGASVEVSTPRANEPRLGNVLVDIDVLKQSLLQLSADVVRIRTKDAGNCGSCGPSQLDNSGGRIALPGSDDVSHPPLLSPKAARESVSTNARGHIPVDFGNRADEEAVAADEIESLSSLDDVVRAFLDVVGKCSTVTARSQETLDLIDKRSRKSVYGEKGDFVDGTFHPNVSLTVGHDGRSGDRKPHSPIDGRSCNGLSKTKSSVLSKSGYHPEHIGGSPARHELVSEGCYDRDCNSRVNTPLAAHETWKTVPSKSPGPSKVGSRPSLSGSRASEVMVDIASEQLSTKKQRSNQKSSDLTPSKNRSNIVVMSESAIVEQQRALAAKSFFEADVMYDAVFRKDSLRRPPSSNISNSPSKRSNRPMSLSNQLSRHHDSQL